MLTPSPIITQLLADYNPEEECRAWLAELCAAHDARRASQPRPRLSYEEATRLYAPGCKCYTRAEGEAVVEAIRQAGYPKAQLIGSLAAKGESTKDVDILIPLRYRRCKSRCVEVMRKLFVPSCISLDCRGMDGFGMVAEPHGVLDFFFNTRDFTYGWP